jgi:TRAP-type mannitol/chloroaromatic compound transport system permease large subunit
MCAEALAVASSSHAITVKAAVPDRDLQLGEIFRGAAPYWILLLVVVLFVFAFPSLATYLPKL